MLGNERDPGNQKLMRFLIDLAQHKRIIFARLLRIMLDLEIADKRRVAISKPAMSFWS